MTTYPYSEHFYKNGMPGYLNRIKYLNSQIKEYQNYIDDLQNVINQVEQEAEDRWRDLKDVITQHD